MGGLLGGHQSVQAEREETLGVADATMYEAKQRRNAWTGIEGIHWPGDGEDLRRAIKMSPGELAEDGCIRAIESIDDIAEVVESLR
mgnify:CR=1 FL=1